MRSRIGQARRGDEIHQRDGLIDDLAANQVANDLPTGINIGAGNRLPQRRTRVLYQIDEPQQFFVCNF